MRLDIAYFAENWKYYSKINFKCVNSVVGPIFNESFAEKSGLWVPWTVHETHWTVHNHMKRSSQKKKKRKRQNVDASSCIQTGT